MVASFFMPKEVIKVALTEKQKRFADEYLIDLNATRAYKAAYSNVKKDNVAAVNGSKMLRNAKVAEYIEKRMKDRERRTEITQDMVLKELAAIGFAKASDYAKVVEVQAACDTEDGERIPLYDANGNPVMINDIKLALTDSLSEEQLKAIAGIKHGKFGIEVSLCDKVKSLELLGKHLGMFKDKVEVSGIEKEKSKLDALIEQMRGDG